MNRLEFANGIAAGLSGWLQLQLVQKLGGLSGEDSARLVVAQIVNAQGRYEPATSQLPPNWGSTKKRVDIALKGRSSEATTWYGAIEIKWPGESFDVAKTRMLIVQDAMRLTFIDTGNLNAHFLVLGGSSESLKQLFDEAHSQSASQEERRMAFCNLLSRNLKKPSRAATYAQWSAAFPDAGERVPATIFLDFRGKLKTELLAVSKASIGGETHGKVFIWQCNRTRGPS